MWDKRVRTVKKPTTILAAAIFTLLAAGCSPKETEPPADHGAPRAGKEALKPDKPTVSTGPATRSEATPRPGTK